MIIRQLPSMRNGLNFSIETSIKHKINEQF